MTEAELVQLMKDWKDEMKGVVGDYTAMLGKLDTAVTLVDAQKKKWYERYKWLITLVVVALIVIGIAITMNKTNTCSVTLSTDKGISVESCKTTK